MSQKYQYELKKKNVLPIMSLAACASEANKRNASAVVCFFRVYDKNRLNYCVMIKHKKKRRKKANKKIDDRHYSSEVKTTKTNMAGVSIIRRQQFDITCVRDQARYHGNRR